jgi:hypothetical protein
MTVKIQNQTKKKQNVRVKVLKAPFVDSIELRKIIFERSRAVVL